MESEQRHFVDDEDIGIEWELVSHRVGHDIVMFHLEQFYNDVVWNVLRQRLSIMTSFQVQDCYHHVLWVGLYSRIYYIADDTGSLTFVMDFHFNLRMLGDWHGRIETLWVSGWICI